MAVHRRSAIAVSVRDRLAGIEEFSAPKKCERGRSAAIPQELLPAITVAWGEAGEGSSRRASAGPAGEDGYDRALSLSVIVHIREKDGEDEFDRIALLIEPVLEQDVTLGGLVTDIELISTRFAVDPRTGIPLGVGVLTYQIRFKTLAADPSVSAL